MEKRMLSLQCLLTQGNVIKEHMDTFPEKVLMISNGTLVSCSVDEVKTFHETAARNALLDQMTHLKEGQVAVASYEDDDFLSHVITLNQISK